jgi:predicted SAM-dependent methyltransferase
MKKKQLRVNIGCGMTPTKGWLNYDNSISIRLSQYYSLAFILRKLAIISEEQFNFIKYCRNNNISFANATKKMPFKDSSVNVLYSSHMLEHLSRRDSKIFLKEASRILENGGILRIAIPDLEHFINSYSDHNDADRFMRDIVVEAPSIETWYDKVNLLISGYRHHQWMYNKESIKKLVESFGFINVKILDAGETIIEKPGKLDLYERSDQSLYLEAKKG